MFILVCVNMFIKKSIQIMILSNDQTENWHHDMHCSMKSGYKNLTPQVYNLLFLKWMEYFQKRHEYEFSKSLRKYYFNSSLIYIWQISGQFGMSWPELFLTEIFAQAQAYGARVPELGCLTRKYKCRILSGEMLFVFLN